MESGGGEEGVVKGLGEGGWVRERGRRGSVMRRGVVRFMSLDVLGSQKSLWYKRW